MWDAGNFAAIAEKILDAGETVVERGRVEPGHGRAGRGVRNRQRDAAGGEGRRRGSRGSTSRRALLEIARERAADAMVEIDFIEGDAQALPFDDASFDRVVSTFGHMFAPDHRRTADEMTRVLRPAA